MKSRKGTSSNSDLEATPHYESTLDAINKIFKDEGLTGLYNGINGALIGVASTNFAYFYWYSVVRAAYVASGRGSNTPGTAVELSLGAIAGAIAQIFTIPVSVVTTRQQTQSREDKKGLIETAREVIDGEDGWTGLWRGLKASLVLVVNPAITYGAYQRLKEILFPGKNNLRPWEAFGENLTHYGFDMKQNVNKICSSRSNVQGPSNNGYAAIDRCQGRPAIKASTRPAGKAIQGFR